MKVLVCGRIYNKFQEAKWFEEQINKLYPEFDCVIFCNASEVPKEYSFKNLIMIPTSDTYNLVGTIPGTKGTRNHEIQVGGTTLFTEATKYIAQNNYDYAVTMCADEIPVDHVIYDRIKELEESDYEIITHTTPYACNEVYGGHYIQKGNTNFFSLETLLQCWNFNIERTCTILCKKYKTKYMTRRYKYGYDELLGTVHFASEWKIAEVGVEHNYYKECFTDPTFINNPKIYLNY